MGGSPAGLGVPGSRTGALGVGAGGKIAQKIYPDPFGLDTWDAENSGAVFVHLLSVGQYVELTGRKPPPSPVDARTYTEHGLPWFELYEEDRGDVAASDSLARVRTVGEQAAARGEAGEPDASVPIPPSQVKKLKPRAARKGTRARRG